MFHRLENENHSFFFFVFSFRCLHFCVAADGNEIKMTATKYDRTLRSIESLEPVHMVIHNNTRRFVDVYWISYDSRLVRYKTLRAQDSLTVNTFKSHPWIFRDYSTGVPMHVDHKEVLWPIVQAETDQERPCHRVNIHFPMQSLRTISLWSLVLPVRNLNEIEKMEIPATLRYDLEMLFRQFDNHRQKLVNAARMRATNR